jgi:hypothetical protein
MLLALRSLLLVGLASLAACAVNTNDNDPQDGSIDVFVDDIPSTCEGLYIEIKIIQGDLVVGPYAETVENGQVHFTAYEGNVAGQRSDADLNANLPIEIEIRILKISPECEALIESRLGIDITAGANGTVLTSGYVTGSSGVWSADFSGFHKDNQPH